MPASALWITLAGLVLAAAWLPVAQRAEGWLRSALKALPLCLFAVAALVSDGPAYLTMALMLSALGDLALSLQARVAVLYGLAAFALAHLCYILLFLHLSQLPLWDAFATAPLPAAGVVALALSTEIWLTPHTGALRWPVRAFVALITALMLAALTLPPAIPGASLFAASELLLALWFFRRAGGSPWASSAAGTIWIIYMLGQVLILWGTLAA